MQDHRTGGPSDPEVSSTRTISTSRRTVVPVAALLTVSGVSPVPLVVMSSVADAVPVVGAVQFSVEVTEPEPPVEVLTAVPVNVKVLL